MTINTAISHADALRPSSATSEMKYMWINELEGKVADFLGEEYTPTPTGTDKTLLMPFPGDNIYELYLVAMYDFYNQDAALYQVDYVVYNNALEEAKALCIRNNDPKESGIIEVM